MNCSYISEKISKFFHGLIFRNLKITKITKMILATINLPKGTHLKASGPYQNVKVLLKVSELYRKLYLCFCPNFQVKKKKKQKQKKDFVANLYLLFNPLTAKSIILCARKRFQMLPPQTEQCLNIVWVTGAGRRQRALRTRGTNIKTIFIKIPAVKGLRGDNAYTKLCNFLSVLLILCLIVGSCGSLWTVLACCGSLHSLV